MPGVLQGYCSRDLVDNLHLIGDRIASEWPLVGVFGTVAERVVDCSIEAE